MDDRVATGLETLKARGRRSLANANALALGILLSVQVATAYAAPGPSESATYVLTPTPVPPKTSQRSLMQPFPIVRIAGRVTVRGARIRLLSVQAPPGARIVIRCRGRHCRVKMVTRLVGVTAASVATGMSVLTFPSFERRFRGGTTLQIAVTRGDEIGKYTSFQIRAGRLPVRRDACVEPSNPQPIACPAS
jgi:hypothetical protein